MIEILCFIRPRYNTKHCVSAGQTGNGDWVHTHISHRYCESVLTAFTFYRLVFLSVCLYVYNIAVWQLFY